MRKNFLKLTSMLASCAMLATAIVPVSVHATPLVFDQMTEKNGFNASFDVLKCLTPA